MYELSEFGGATPKVPPNGNPSPALSTRTARIARTTRQINGAIIFPKQSLPLWGPSYTLLIRLRDIGLASRRRPSFLSYVCSAVHFLDSALFKMLLWPPGNSKLRSASFVSKSQVPHFCHTSLLIFTFSKCVISLRPLFSSRSFQKRQ